MKNNELRWKTRVEERSVEARRKEGRKRMEQKNNREECNNRRIMVNEVEG